MTIDIDTTGFSKVQLVQFAALVTETAEQINSGKLDAAWVLEGLERLTDGSQKAKSELLEEPEGFQEVDGVAHFSTQEKFQLEQVIDGITIARIGMQAEAHLARGSGKVERNVPPTKLQKRRPKKTLTYTQIYELLGEESLLAIACFWALLKAQGNGEAGFLQVNGKPNVLLVRDQAGTLWALYGSWEEARVKNQKRGWWINLTHHTRYGKESLLIFPK